MLSQNSKAKIQNAFVLFPRGLIFVEPGGKQFVQFSSHNIVDKETSTQVAICASTTAKDVEWCIILEGVRAQEQRMKAHCCG